MNTKSQGETTETTVKVDETGDTNQNTQNKGTTNQKSSDKTISLEPTNKGSCFTLATEKPYLAYLHKAVELWEKSLGSGAVFDGIDLDSHIEAIVACGTRLIAIKQVGVNLVYCNIFLTVCYTKTMGTCTYEKHFQSSFTTCLLEADKIVCLSLQNTLL